MIIKEQVGYTPSEIMIFSKAIRERVQGEDFTPATIRFVLEMVFPTLFGNLILPEQKHRQKGETHR